jgi:hypothetical protein
MVAAPNSRTDNASNEAVVDFMSGHLEARRVDALYDGSDRAAQGTLDSRKPVSADRPVLEACRLRKSTTRPGSAGSMPWIEGLYPPNQRASVVSRRSDRVASGESGGTSTQPPFLWLSSTASHSSTSRWPSRKVAKGGGAEKSPPAT